MSSRDNRIKAEALIEGLKADFLTDAIAEALEEAEERGEESIVCLKEEIRQRRKDALEYTATITRLREGIYDIKNITDDYDAPIGRLMAANSLARSLLGVKDE